MQEERQIWPGVASALFWQARWRLVSAGGELQRASVNLVFGRSYPTHRREGNLSVLQIENLEPDTGQRFRPGRIHQPPRSALAEWAPQADRADPVDILIQQGKC